MKSNKGATVVEFALIAVLLFTILFGIFEGGRVFHGWLVITNEAREAARWGAVRCVETGNPYCYQSYAELEAAMENHVMERTAGSVNQNPAVFGVNAIATQTAVTVQITYTVEIVTPLISALWPNFPLAAESVMRLE